MRRIALTIVAVVASSAMAQAHPRLPVSPTPPSREADDPSTPWHFLGPIVFSRSADGDTDLWMVRSDGSRLEHITWSGKDDTEPTWAPRGTNIVFVRTGDAGRSHLFTMNTRRGRPELLLRNGSAPAWSPDGSRLAFARTVEDNTDVYTVAADGTDLVRVTSDLGVDTDPTWGPAGSRLTFASDRDGDFDIYSAAPDGSDIVAITDDGADQRNPWDLWTWRDVGYDQGPTEDPTWCWQTIGVPATIPGEATQCADPGVHSYAVGTWSPWSRLEPSRNGTTHLWAWAPGDDIQLTSGRSSDADPAVRPATRAVVRALTAAARDIDVGLQGAVAWVDANGSGAGADESATGLITLAPSLCLVDADERSRASTTSCDAGSGVGSTSAFADPDQIAVARDTGLGICLWATYRESGGWGVSFGTTDTASACTGNDARSATSNSW